MIYIIYMLHIVISLFLILVVLLQQGKGADLSVFGGGATQAAFGARGAATLLHKLTVFGFVAFVLTTMTIGFMTSSGGKGTVMSDVPVEAAAEEEAPAATGTAAAADGAANDSGTDNAAPDAPGDGTATAESETPGDVPEQTDE